MEVLFVDGRDAANSAARCAGGAGAPVNVPPAPATAGRPRRARMPGSSQPGAAVAPAACACVCAGARGCARTSANDWVNCIPPVPGQIGRAHV